MINVIETAICVIHAIESAKTGTVRSRHNTATWLGKGVRGQSWVKKAESIRVVKDLGRSGYTGTRTSGCRGNVGFQIGNPSIGKVVGAGAGLIHGEISACAIEFQGSRARHVVEAPVTKHGCLHADAGVGLGHNIPCRAWSSHIRTERDIGCIYVSKVSNDTGPSSPVKYNIDLGVDSLGPIDHWKVKTGK